jgi:hypothetical protein
VRVHVKLAVTAAFATAVLAAAIGTAPAGKLSFSSQTFRAVWGELLFDIRPCEIVIEGSFHARTFAKTAETLLGHVTRATVNALFCQRIIVLASSLPWRIRYESFTGTLPQITAIKALLLGAGILIKGTDLLGRQFECLYQTSEVNELRVSFIRAANGTLTSIKPDETVGIPIATWLSSAICTPDLFLSNQSESLTVLNAATLISLTLI